MSVVVEQLLLEIRDELRAMRQMWEADAQEENKALGDVKAHLESAAQYAAKMERKYLTDTKDQ